MPKKNKIALIIIEKKEIVIYRTYQLDILVKFPPPSSGTPPEVGRLAYEPNRFKSVRSGHFAYKLESRIFILWKFSDWKREYLNSFAYTQKLTYNYLLLFKNFQVFKIAVARKWVSEAWRCLENALNVQT
jgi:hypothetical protein